MISLLNKIEANVQSISLMKSQRYKNNNIIYNAPFIYE